MCFLTEHWWAVVAPGFPEITQSGVILTPNHQILGKMTPSCTCLGFSAFFESEEIFQKFHP